jgi:hypothetical protein
MQSAVKIRFYLHRFKIILPVALLASLLLPALVPPSHPFIAPLFTLYEVHLLLHQGLFSPFLQAHEYALL